VMESLKAQRERLASKLDESGELKDQYSQREILPELRELQRQAYLAGLRSLGIWSAPREGSVGEEIMLAALDEVEP
jgi:hypothetical protein